MQVIRLKQDVLTIDVLIDEYVTSLGFRDITKKTMDNYNVFFSKVLPKYLDTTSEIDNDVVLSTIQNIKNAELSDSSKAGYLNLFRGFLIWVNKNYDTHIELPTVKKVDTVKRTYTDEELSKLLAKPKKWRNFCDYRAWMMVNILIDTGMRSGTLRAILIKDVDFDNHFIQARHTKNKKPLIIPLSPYIEKELRHYMKTRGGNPDDFLFCDWQGNELQPAALQRTIYNYNHRRGVDYTSVHAFRHTMARKYLIEMNGSISKLQTILGHSSIEMTAHYAKVYSTDVVNDYRDSSPITFIKKDTIKLTK